MYTIERRREWQPATGISYAIGILKVFLELNISLQMD